MSENTDVFNKYLELNKEANDFRKNKMYNLAIDSYFKAEKFSNDNNIDLSTSSRAYWIAGVINCYRKSGDLKSAINFINRYMKNEESDDLLKYNWLCIEIFYSYKEYYFNKNYANIKHTILAARRLLSVSNNNSSKSNNRDYATKIIYDKLFKNNSELEDYADELLELLDYMNIGYEYKYKHSMLNSRRFDKLERLINYNMDNTANERKDYSKYLMAYKFKLLYIKGDYNKIIELRNNIFNSGNICKVLDTVERETAKAYIQLGEKSKAIETIENAIAEYGENFYFYKDLAEIYFLEGDYEKSLFNYYKYCLSRNDMVFITNALLEIVDILKNKMDKPIQAKEHLDLYFKIKDQTKTKVKNKAKVLWEELKDVEIEDVDYKERTKYLKSMWKNEISINKTCYEGRVSKIGTNGKFGFIESSVLEEAIYFKIKKDLSDIKVGDTVSFVVEKSYDRIKNRYSEAAADIKIIADMKEDDDFYYDDFEPDWDEIDARSSYGGLSKLRNEMGIPDEAIGDLENWLDRD